MASNTQAQPGVTQLGFTPARQAVLTVRAANNPYVNAAVQGLKTTGVSDQAGTLGNVSAIQASFQGKSVGIVSLPQSAIDQSGLTRDILAQQIGQESGYSTVIIFDGSSTVGVSANTQKATDTIKTAINSALGKGQSPAEALSTAQGQIINAGTVTSTNSGAGGTDLAPVLGGVGGGLLGVIVIGAVGATILRRTLRRRQPRVTGQGEQQSYVPASKLSEYLPEDLKKLVRQLDETARKHARLADDNLAPQIAKIIKNLQELFKRINKQGETGGSNARLASIEYEDKLQKLVAALGPDYYLDIAAQPDLWDNPQERLHAVDEAVDAVEYQLVENIKQVNASKDLKFQVALDSLMGNRGATLQDIYNPQNKGETK